MKKIGEHHGLIPLVWKKGLYQYVHEEWVAETPLGVFRVRQKVENGSATVELPRALIDGAPSNLQKERSRINSPSPDDAKDAAYLRYFLHVRSILSGSWQYISWKRRTDIQGEHYTGISHFGRWRIGFLFDNGARMGYVSSPAHTDDPRSPRPYYPNATLDSLKETVADLNVALGKKAIIHIDDAYRAMVNKDGKLKKLNWVTDTKSHITVLSVPVGDITISPEKNENGYWHYNTSLPWMVSEPMNDADGDFSEADTDLKSAKQKVEEALQVLAHRFTE